MIDFPLFKKRQYFLFPCGSMQMDYLNGALSHTQKWCCWFWYLDSPVFNQFNFYLEKTKLTAFLLLLGKIYLKKFRPSIW